MPNYRPNIRIFRPFPQKTIAGSPQMPYNQRYHFNSKGAFPMSDHKMRFETIQLHAGQEQADPATGAKAVPIYQSTSFVFDNAQQAVRRFDLSEGGYIYSRISNPTCDAFAARVNAMEGGVGAVATASGSAAIVYGFLGLCGQGDHIVAATTIYGGTYTILAHTLPQYGITCTFVDPSRPESFREAIRENTKALFVETLGNPNSTVADMEAIAQIAHRSGIPLMVDNTFATPYLFRPFEHGADIVVHSATKFLGGHGTTIAGVLVDGGTFDWEASGRFPALVEPNDAYHGQSFVKTFGKAAFVSRVQSVFLHDLGACLSPFNAFLLLQGLETLSLRVERHVENALAVVDFLKNHPKVESVSHPSLPECGCRDLYLRYFPKGAGSIFTFRVKGGEEAAMTFCNRLRIFSLLANVADVKSLVIHPATTTHGQMTQEEQAEAGICPNTIRLSIGTEHIDDILWDLDQALQAI